MHATAQIVLSALLAGNALAAQPPGGWVSVPPPATAAEWSCANRSEAVRISAAGSALKISPFREADAVVLALPGGKLVGIDRGEFGGSVTWHDSSTGKATTVVKANPVALLSTGQGIFLFSGLAHLATDSGRIFKLERRQAGWSAAELLDLGGAPGAIHSLDDESTLVLTTTGVTQVNLRTLEKTRLFENGNWRYLYGNSIVRLQNDILVGARRAVIRLAPSERGGYHEQWWVPAACPRRSGKDCSCVR